MNIVYHHRTRATDAQRVHILELVQALRQLGHAVRIVGLADPEATREQAGRDGEEAWWKRLTRKIPFSYEALQLGYHAVGIPLLIWNILRTNAGFVYERHSLLNVSGIVAACLTRRPLLLEVNSPLALEQQREREIRLVRLARWLETFTCNAASRVIVVSGPLKRILIESGVKDNKIAVMPNGVDPDRFQATLPPSELRARLGLEGRKVIGFVGWFRRWHGLEMLLDAFAQAGLAQRNASLLLIGDGPATPDLRAQATALGIQDAVVFSGGVPHRLIPDYLGLVDIAVQPAANEYCCPMKIIEYMGMGKAIVAPRQENITELLNEGQEAELFTPGCTAALADALLKLVDQPNQRAALGQQARDAISRRRLLWRENARRVVELAHRGSPTTPVACPASSTR